MTPGAIIFRKRLLSYSETFIADQGRKLDRYRAIFAGFELDPSGIDMIADSPRELLCDYSPLPGLSKLAFRCGLPANRGWMNALAAQRPALLHAHFFNDGVDAVKIGQRLDLPVITTVHGHDITKSGNAEPDSRRTRRFFRQVDRVIAVSDFIAARALARGCPENKLLRHYIGIDLNKFTQQKNETERPSLLFVGRLVEKKGGTYLLQAMQKLMREFPDLRLTVVGDGPQRKSLGEEAQARGLDVEFTGAVDAARVRGHLARCWAFVAPSIVAQSGDAEGLGMVFLEAQALRTPVVSFRSGGLVEAVDEGRTALLCEERDVGGLAENIRLVLRDASLRHTMGLEGRRRIESYFDLQKQCAALETIYDETR